MKGICNRHFFVKHMLINPFGFLSKSQFNKHEKSFSNITVEDHGFWVQTEW